MNAAKLYWIYIFDVESILLKIVKLRNAEPKAPSEDMKTNIAAQVPLLTWLT
jgi:hypothetical protein